MGPVTDRVKVSSGVAAYEDAWRAPGTAGLAEVFTEDAVYPHTPYEEPVAGLDAIRRMWNADRDGPDEVFTLATSILAVDGDTAVVRAEVRYGDPLRQEYRDLWILRMDDDGRCRWFEEWPCWPGRPTPPATTTEHAFRSCRAQVQLVLAAADRSRSAGDGCVTLAVLITCAAATRCSVSRNAIRFLRPEK
jgi:ketosteroid isomerase-like protein